ncbi:Fc.00g078440.m01.CDS01 [Cosmosporella sp. VM-42]
MQLILVTLLAAAGVLALPANPPQLPANPVSAIPAGPVSLNVPPDYQAPSVYGFALDTVPTAVPRDIDTDTHFTLPVENPVVTVLKDLHEDTRFTLPVENPVSTRKDLNEDTHFTLPVEDPVTFITARHELPECIIPTLSDWTMEPGQTHIARAYLHCTMKPRELGPTAGGQWPSPTDDTPLFPTDQLTYHSTGASPTTTATREKKTFPSIKDWPSYPTDQLTTPTDGRTYPTGSDLFGWLTQITPVPRAEQSNGIWIAPDVPTASTFESLILIPLDSAARVELNAVKPTPLPTYPTDLPTAETQEEDPTPSHMPGQGHGPVMPLPPRPSTTTEAVF